MKKNILIYPCAADNALEIFESLRYSLHFNIYGGNAHNSIADLIMDNEIIILPKINDQYFIEKINEAIEEFKIDFIFPTHDDVIYFLSQHQEKINTTIIGADRQLNEVCRYKKQTYNYFKGLDYIPKVYNSIHEVIEFPVFCKPDKGQGSIGAFKIHDISGLSPQIFEDNVITEYLPGDEYTVDCLTDKDHQLRYAFPRKRAHIRNGVSYVNTETHDEKIIDACHKIALDINEKLNIKGLWFFQVKLDKYHQVKLLEICPRMASTMAFSRYKGVNLPLLTMFTYMDYPIKVDVVHHDVELYRYSTTKAKYTFNYQNLYIDFDDTIIINGQVCLDAMALMYQCKNENKKVYLITKHEFDLNETLKKYCISKDLFDGIIHINMDDSKYKFIDTNSIFVDNYYKERQEVYTQLGIPVFDVEGIRSLIK